MAGAGGWGDPLERDPERVVKDVRNEFVSLEAAAAEYGVIVDPRTWAVDRAATAARRHAIRHRRGWAKVPFVDRGELPPGVLAAK